MIYDLQKAGTWKRVSAFLFDFTISTVLITGMVLLLVWAFGFEKHTTTFREKQEYYAEKYGIDLEMTQEQFDKMTEAEQEDYLGRVEQSNKDIARDRDAVVAYNMVIYLPFIFLTLGAFIVCVLYEFVVPMVFKNGQTLGKKIFGLGVIRTNCVKASGVSLFVRMAFGKFVIETIVPISIVFMMLTQLLSPLVALIVLLGILILEFIVYFTTKRTRSTIHDLIADTAVVDLSTQLVFDSEEKLIEYKKKIHEEMVANSPY